MQHYIRFDKRKAKALEQAYAQAIAAHQTSFYFEGEDYLTDYAKYVLEFLRGKGVL